MNAQQKIEKPSPLLLLLESRVFLELGSYFAFMPLLKNFDTFPKGDGHPILVLPGFTASDLSTQILRDFLTQLGYTPYPWKLGRNWAHYDELEVLMNERVKWIKNQHNQKVSLIGWSLGGIYAREIAKALPDDIRQVITLGSPFRGIGQDNNVNWIYELVTGREVRDIEPDLVAKVISSPPVPTTAIFTRSDGIVPWETCTEKVEGPITENIEVISSHCGLGFNPMVLLHIAERLAQPEGQWKPFKEKYKSQESFKKQYNFK